jgi:hypothetical protein
MATDIYPDEGTRRARTTCKACGVAVDVAGLREHLRAEHQMDTATADALALAARIESRKSQRPRNP